MSPMAENMANADGSVSDKSIAYYAERAKGGAGVIITGITTVEYPRGKSASCETRLDNVKYVAGWAKMAREIHRYGALVITQIVHAGQTTDEDWTEGVAPARIAPVNAEAAKLKMGSKTTGYDFSSQHVLTTEELKELEQKFINAAVYAEMSGVDGVEVHAAHGYLISQLLNPTINTRTDEYGGSLENRCRFAVNVIRGIKEKVDPNFIVGCRLTGHLVPEDGMTDEDCIKAAQLMEAAGVDYINVSNGFSGTKHSIVGYRLPYGNRVVLAEKLMGKVKVPVLCAGKLREPDFCEKLLADGKMDFVVVGRALICDPEWPNKARTGRAAEIRRCISCRDACYGYLSLNRPISCAINPEVGYEREMSLVPNTTPKHVLVIGGGLAGMQSAITASKRGHKVTLIEESDHFGGQAVLASLPPKKQDTMWAVEWFAGELSRRQVDARLNTKATIELVKEIAPDVVIMAAGSKPWIPPIPGIERGLKAWDVLTGKCESFENQSVVMIGGGIVGCEVAEFVAARGNKVTIIEMQPILAKGLEGANKVEMLEEFEKLGVEYHLNAVTKKVTDDAVIYEADGREISVPCDKVIVCTGNRQDCGELTQQITDAGFEVISVGDAVQVGKMVNATQSGLCAAINI